MQNCGIISVKTKIKQTLHLYPVMAKSWIHRNITAYWMELITVPFEQKMKSLRRRVVANMKSWYFGRAEQKRLERSKPRSCQSCPGGLGCLPFAFPSKAGILLLLVHCCCFRCVTSAYQTNNFLISLPKHMLWVLKRTVSKRRFFWAPKTYVKTDRWENIYNFTPKKCLSKPMKVLVSFLVLQPFLLSCTKICVLTDAWMAVLCVSSSGRC